MTTYVLVHGAFGGAWGWRRVRPLLWAKGHLVFTPTLTGLGERVHLAGPEVNLSTHITDVVNCLYFEDLTEVVLVGHSYGGMVITGVADAVPERIAHLVYVDAILPEDGQSGADMGELPPRDGWRIPLPATELPPDETPEQAWARVRLVPHPVATLEEKLHLSQPLESRPFTRTYIKAGNEPYNPDNPGNFWRAANRVRNHPAWRYVELPSGHSIQRDMPNELVALLLELA
jgi:pimeloyl-ACP methyl ester carboxylesterase